MKVDRKINKFDKNKFFLVFFIKSGQIAIVLPEYKDFEIIKIKEGFNKKRLFP
jgi:hypothetical protein